jgi:hypothetical protein
MAEQQIVQGGGGGLGRRFDPFWFIDPDFKPDVGREMPSSPFKVAWYYCTLPGMGIGYRLATVAAQLALYLGVALAANGRVGPQDFLGIFTVVVTGYLAFYGILLLDDVIDRNADAVAHPERPLPSDAIRIRDYWIVILTCGNIAVALYQQVWPPIVAPKRLFDPFGP